MERAKRTIAEGVAELVEAKIAQGVAAGEWVDQNHSPIGKRRHLELARTGKVPSRKVGKQVLIRRTVLNDYLDREGISRARPVEDEDVLDVVERIAAGGKRR